MSSKTDKQTTEEEYIRLTDLTKLRIARVVVLDTLVPERGQISNVASFADYSTAPWPDEEPANADR